MRGSGILGLVLLYLLAAAQAVAQSATLLADQVEIRADRTIVASGNVEVLFGASHLTAQALEYDSVAEVLRIIGPITLTDGDTIIVLADQAELSADMENGIMQGARMVLDQQLQLAAREINRVNGRYTQLYKTVASSCQVCADRPVPLWQIRARRVIHDQEERQLYFHNAQFRIADIPVFYLPRLRMPDPTLERARGFLVPDASTSTTLGLGLRMPYFIPIGDRADVTLTPFLSEKTRTLELRYRQAFRTGTVLFQGAITKDSLGPDGIRSYLFGAGSFHLPRDFELLFDIEATSDPAYLLQYGYSGKDRLDSAVAVTRTRRNQFINAGVVGFKTLRGSELAIDDQLPNFQGELEYKKRFSPASIGGQGSWQLRLQGHTRASTADEIGRDVLRLDGRLDWSRDWVLGNGLVARAGARIAADAYQINHDSTYKQFLAHGTPAFEAELRWPLVRSGRGGASELLEPVAHLAWTDDIGAVVPNEDSNLVEFDEGNLFSISRFPGADRYERGTRTTVGLVYSRFDPDGWSLGVTAGKVFRTADLSQFSAASGLDGRASDWLLAGQLKLESQLAVTARMLIKDDLSLNKAEARVIWNRDRFDLASAYTWIVADPDENRADKTSQMTVDASYDFNRHWEGQLDLRYDFEAKKATSAAVGLMYRNECVTLDLSLSRRFTSSTSVVPTTNFGFSVALNGFGSDGRAYRRSCSG